MLIEQQQTKPNPIKTDSALNCFIGNLDFDRAQWSQLIQLCKCSPDACKCTSVREAERRRGRRDYQMFF